jgi:general transcription factor 3C polypeptide 3 (transcription factor C subunit 4)
MILQGFTFIMNYYRLTLKKAESYSPRQGARIRQNAEYNVGRAFHQLGLLTFASRYFEKVIEISEEFGGLERDLVFEAVHNLNLIMCLAGNVKAAKALTEKYLVI